MRNEAMTNLRRHQIRRLDVMCGRPEEASDVISAAFRIRQTAGDRNWLIATGVEVSEK